LNRFAAAGILPKPQIPAGLNGIYCRNNETIAVRWIQTSLDNCLNLVPSMIRLTMLCIAFRGCGRCFLTGGLAERKLGQKTGHGFNIPAGIMNEQIFVRGSRKKHKTFGFGNSKK
jgi:hypothetical protein